MPVFRRLFQFSTGAAAAGTASWLYYTRNVHFVHPYDMKSPDWDTPIIHKVNPRNNVPLAMDHAIRQVPLSQLKTGDVAELTTEFNRGMWGGPGFAIQRYLLGNWHRAKEGRQNQLWDKEQLLASDYPVGTEFVDHMEVIERTKGAVVLRSGDSPTVQGEREADGIVSLEVTKDKSKTGEDVATFHVKAIFVNGLPTGPQGPLPWYVLRAHFEYSKLLIETSVRRLLK